MISFILITLKLLNNKFLNYFKLNKILKQKYSMLKYILAVLQNI